MHNVLNVLIFFLANNINSAATYKRVYYHSVSWPNLGVISKGNNGRPTAAATAEGTQKINGRNEHRTLNCVAS